MTCVNCLDIPQTPTDSSSPRQHQANDTMIGCAMQGKEGQAAQRHESCHDGMGTVSAPFRRICQVKAGGRPCSNSTRVGYSVTNQKPRTSTIQASGRPTWCHQIYRPTCINRDRHRSSEGRASRVGTDPKEGLMRHLQIDYLPTSTDLSFLPRYLASHRRLLWLLCVCCVAWSLLNGLEEEERRE